MKPHDPGPPSSPADRWAIVLGASSGTGAAIARAVARDPGLNLFGVHRGNFPAEAAALESEIRSSGRRAVLHENDAGLPERIRPCAETYREVAGTRSVALVVHALSGASIGRFLPGESRGLHPRQIEKTFNYLAHSFVYWTQTLLELDLLAPGARILGLTNALHDSLIDGLGLIASAKEALQSYVRSLAIELGPGGHRVNLLKFPAVITPALETVLGPTGLRRLEEVHRQMIPAGRMCTLEEVGRIVSVLAREETEWFNGATIDYMGGSTLKLLDLVMDTKKGKGR